MRSQIREYWILDINARKLYMFREPGTEGYANFVVLAESDLIAPLEFPFLSGVGGGFAHQKCTAELGVREDVVVEGEVGGAVCLECQTRSSDLTKP